MSELEPELAPLGTPEECEQGDAPSIFLLRP